jgi:hypothetical protein
MEVQREACDQSFWVHPVLGDAAIHVGAALRDTQHTSMMVSVAIGCYAVQAALQGMHVSPVNRL